MDTLLLCPYRRYGHCVIFFCKHKTVQKLFIKKRKRSQVYLRKTLQHYHSIEHKSSKKVKVAQLCPTLRSARLLCPWNSQEYWSG